MMVDQVVGGSWTVRFLEPPAGADRLPYPHHL